MIDADNRRAPRFSAGKENIVREEIRKHLKKEVPGHLKGIAGAACGGDILFHELCGELGIPTTIYLALTVEAFKKTSVSFAGKSWEDRYDRLLQKLPSLVLPEKHSYNGNTWEQANLWMLNTALKNGAENMSLLALWDGKAGDGDGGTEHMIRVCRSQGATVEVIDITRL